MKVGCGEWGFRDLPMEDHFRIAQKFGFSYLEFGIGGGQTGRLPEELTDGDADEFRGLGEQYGIRTPFCCIENDFTLADEIEHQQMLENVQKQIRWAAQCSATHVRLFAGFTPVANMDEAIWVRTIDAFRVCDQLCEQLGLVIAIETHGALTFHEDGSATHTNTATTDRDGLMRLQSELPGRIGFNFDPGNIKVVHPEDRRLCLDVINDRINYCHMKDWRRTGEGWIACAIGDDDLDYKPLFDEMKFDGVYLIEYEPLDDKEDGIRRSLDYLKSIGVDVDLGV